jgi:hypothetical protein
LASAFRSAKRSPINLASSRICSIASRWGFLLRAFGLKSDLAIGVPFAQVVHGALEAGPILVVSARIRTQCAGHRRTPVRSTAKTGMRDGYSDRPVLKKPFKYEELVAVLTRLKLAPIE